jgi:hypothetical protein
MLSDHDTKNINDLYDYVMKRCDSKKLSQKLSSSNLDAIDIASYLSNWDQSKGKFLYVVSMLNAIEFDLIPLKNISNLKTSPEHKSLPPGLDGFYCLAFQSIFSNMDGYALTRQILGVMCEAMEPLGLIELAAIIGCDLNLIRATLQPLQTLLIQRNSYHENKTLVSFQHHSLFQWLTDVDAQSDTHTAYPFEVDLMHSKRMINRWALTEVEKGKAYTWSYLTRHLSSHLNHKEKSEIIPKLLRNFEWIQARLQNTSINTLLDDFQIDGVNCVDQDQVLMLLQQALQQSEQVLLVNPNQLASQLLLLLKPHGSFQEIQTICKAAKLWNKVHGINRESSS